MGWASTATLGWDTPGLTRYWAFEAVIDKQWHAAGLTNLKSQIGLNTFTNANFLKHAQNASGLNRYKAFEAVIDKQWHAAGLTNLKSGIELSTFNTNFLSRSAGAFGPQMGKFVATPPLLREVQSLLFPTKLWFSRTFEHLRRAHLLPNWLDVASLDVARVEELLWEGIPLAVIPRADTVAALLEAPDHSTRRRILATRWRSIVTDCESALGQLPGTDQITLTTEAITTIRNGTPRAAQALAVNVIDTVLRCHLHKEFKAATWTNQQRRGFSRPDVERWVSLAVWVFAPVWAAYREYRSAADLRTGTRGLNRHGSAHGASLATYNRPNAVTAIMMATSLLWLAEHHGISSPIISAQ